MYAYTSKQILVGKGRKVTALTFDPNSDILALGFENGLIKLIKFEENQEEEKEFEIVMNEKLKHSHSHAIKTLSWNSFYGKLLSVDSKGLLIVWTENDETYVEEMVNESDKKKIKFARWSKNGSFILIILEGGGAILGNVEGERIWSKDVHIEIEFLDWIENDKTIVLCDKKGELVALETKTAEIFAEYDVSEEQTVGGTDKKMLTPLDSEELIKRDFIKKSSTLEGEEIKNNKNSLSQELVVFDGNTLEEENSRLILCYKSGEIYLIYNLRECDMRKFSFGFSEIMGGSWNKEGDGFALSVKLNNENFVYLFDKQASILFSFNSVNRISNMDFNQFANKLISVDQDKLYLTKIKKKYKHCYLSQKSTFIFMMEELLSSKKTVFFYNLETKTLKKKIMPKAVEICSDSLNYLIVISESFVFKNNFEAKLINHNGAILDSIILVIKPEVISFKQKHCVFGANGKLFIWDFSKSLTNVTTNIKSSKLYFLDLHDTSKILDLTQNWKVEITSQQKDFQIETIDLSGDFMFVSNDKGFVRIFSLNNFVEENPLMLKNKPVKIFVNKAENLIAVLDFDKNLRIQKIQGNNEEVLFVEDVWQFLWGENGSDFYFIKKNELIEKNIEDLEQKKEKQENLGKKEKQEKNGNFIKTDLFLLGITFPHIILFDIENFEQVVSNINIENLSSYSFTKKLAIERIKNIESKINNKSEITFEELIPKNKKENQQVIKFIAESFLLKGNYEEACKAYRYLNNYSALKFIQRLKEGCENEIFKKAETFFFLQKKKEAMDYLQQNNKENLMLKLLEENYQFEDMLEFQNLLDAETLKRVYNKLGEKFEKEVKFEKAINFYEKCGNIEKLIPLYCLNQDFEKLVRVSENEKRKPVLELLANYLLRFNLIDPSARILEELQKAKKSVDVSILHNYWDTAVEIAEKNNFQQIDNLLNKFASILKQKNKKMEVVQLYRKAKKNLEAAKMLNSIAEDLINQNMNPLLVKKVFVLSALEINLENKKRFNPALTSNLTNLTLSDQTRNNTLNTLNTLITSDVSSIGEKILINPWKGAEAWHLYLLALNFLSNKKYREGYIISQKLVNYELELGQKRVFVLGAIFSEKIGFFKQFSKCLSKLENFYKEIKHDVMLKKIENLTIDIFSNKEPVDQDLEDLEILECIGKNCKSYISELDCFCVSCGSNFGICMVSGRSIFSKNYYKCKTCKHKLLQDEIKKNNLKFCSLCHSKIVPENKKKKDK